MHDKIELFNQALRFSTFWISVDLFLIAHFFISWYRSYKQTGWKVDVWNWTLFLIFFVYVFLMYPFNASPLNRYATPQDYIFLEMLVDKAFAITVVGYLSLWMGRYLYDQIQGRWSLRFLKAPIHSFERIVETNILNREGVLVLSGVALCCFTATFFIQIKNGFFLNPRAFFLLEPALRPLYNFTITIFGFLMTVFALRSIQFKDMMSKTLFMTFFILSLFMGIRGLCIAGILLLILYNAFSKSGRLSFLKMGAFCFGLILLGICIECLRNDTWGSFFSFTHLLTNIFYGNHFSDTRDFAWMLYYWDGEYLHGKTYISGLLAFIPRVLSEYRQEWSWGVFAAKVVGFDPSEHPGLRAGLFGEIFFNFGYLGVIFLGTAAGCALRHADVKMREAVAASRSVIKGYAGSIAYIVVSSFFMTAGFWGFYFFIFVNLMLYWVCRNRRLVSSG